MKPLITPVPNLNGNSADDLVRKLRVVLHNIDHLKTSMVEANDITHGRNFQHLDNDGSMKNSLEKAHQASQAWAERYHLLSDFYNEVLVMAIAIQSGEKQP